MAAVSNCSTMGSYLVTVHNQEENVYIQHRHNGERSWIGLNDRGVEGSFAWTNREITSFRFWAEKQPNNHRNQDCVHTLGAKEGYTWNDVSCNNCYKFTCFKGKKKKHYLSFICLTSFDSYFKIIVFFDVVRTLEMAGNWVCFLNMLPQFYRRVLQNILARHFRHLSEFFFHLSVSYSSRFNSVIIRLKKVVI